MIKIVYDSNNSGGDFWLDAADWDALAAAGWSVDRDNQRATIVAESMMDAIARWCNALPHQDPDDEGCQCCGPPHNFYGDRED